MRLRAFATGLLFGAFVCSVGCRSSRGAHKDEKPPPADKPPLVALQPLGDVPAPLLKTVTSGLTRFYRVRLEVLPACGLPAEARIRPGRYKADVLLAFLERSAPKRFDKVLGLTRQDISTQNGHYPDWGIFGLGQMDGRACVVSTKRLAKGRPSAAQFRNRWLSLAAHEVGHTLGLAHCPDLACLMQDAKGRLPKRDDRLPQLCASCRKQLGILAR